jgi:hypothetical protein
LGIACFGYNTADKIRAAPVAQSGPRRPTVVDGHSAPTDASVVAVVGRLAIGAMSRKLCALCILPQAKKEPRCRAGAQVVDDVSNPAR